MPPYVPGKPILEVQQEYGLDKVVKLSSNECPFDLPPELGQAVAAAITGCNRYPDACAGTCGNRWQPFWMWMTTT